MKRQQPGTAANGGDGGAPVRVLFIAGFGRSGSTLLDRLLGADGAFRTSGEVSRAWTIGVLDNRLCSCGESFSACPVWQEIASSAPEALSPAMAKEIGRYHELVLPAKNSWRVLTAKTRRRLAGLAPKGYFDALAATYAGLAQASDDCAVVVDSSKFPVYMFLLSRVADIDLHVVHLVRDPRAVAHSCARPVKRDPDGRTTIRRVSPAKAAATWTIVNASTDWLMARLGIPSVRVRYEDLVGEPTQVVNSLRNFAMTDSRSMPAVIATSVAANGSQPEMMPLADSHMISGNPGRFVQGKVKVAMDREWETSMSRTDRLQVTLLTAPLARRYGYYRRKNPSIRTELPAVGRSRAGAGSRP